MIKQTYEMKLKHLQELVKIQCSNGNWNYDSYMHGMANGMILAEHIITGKQEEIQYLDAPKKWLKDYPTLWVKIKWFFKKPSPIAADE